MTLGLEAKTKYPTSSSEDTFGVDVLLEERGELRAMKEVIINIVTRELI